MSKDTIFLFQAFALGAGITFLYDTLRIIRRAIPHKQIFVSLEDMFFWLVCALYVFWWMYRVSNEGMRWFAVIGAMFGMYLYKKLFSNLLVTQVSRLLRFLLHILGKILVVLLRPVSWLGHKMGFLQKKIQKKRKKFTGNLKIWLKSRAKALKIRLCKR